MAELEEPIIITVFGETCPVPLVEMRKAVLKEPKGALIRIQGDHESSKKEIPMALESLGIEMLELKEDGRAWSILFRNEKKEGGK